MTQGSSTDSHNRALHCLRGRCPHCGTGPLMRDPFRVNANCPLCKASFPVAEGAFLGSMAINYGLVVFGLLPVWLLLWWINAWQITTLAWGALVLAVVGPLSLYSLAWRIWIALGVTFLSENDELP